jgi:hypothetical protein
MQLNHAQKNPPVSINSTLIFSDYFQVFFIEIGISPTGQTMSDFCAGLRPGSGFPSAYVIVFFTFNDRR